ncbi:hypothetical protein [Saccharopolyspora shandongensis]|uniref:hypothetical protein n=1 Tax=Saccharopolyspora shandongensis TaxID=418495 RepID=UPI0033E85737
MKPRRMVRAEYDERRPVWLVLWLLVLALFGVAISVTATHSRPEQPAERPTQVRTPYLSPKDPTHDRN